MHSKINRGKCWTIYANHKGKHSSVEIAGTIKNWRWIVLIFLSLAIGFIVFVSCLVPGIQSALAKLLDEDRPPTSLP